MKKYLHFVFLLFCCLLCLGAYSNSSTNVTFQPTVINTGNTHWRWRNDVNVMYDDGSSSAGWIASTDAVTFSPLVTGRVYRIRMGQNFQITATASATGSATFTNQPAIISGFALRSPIVFNVYYKKEIGGNWKKLPTVKSDTVPFYIAPSQYFDNGLALPAREESTGYPEGSLLGGRQVLPAYGTTGRPNNPYYYLGGMFESKEQTGSVSSIGYSFGTWLYPYNNEEYTTDYSSSVSSGWKSTSSVGNKFLTGTGGASSQISSGSGGTVLNLGAEVEASMIFTPIIKSGETYYLRIELDVHYDGQGRKAGSDTYSQYYRYFQNQELTTYMEGYFTIPALVLPVSLKSFIATKQGTSALLNWVTASEINNKGFYVQRSTDGKSFSNLGFVSSLASGGNSNTTLNYSYTDATSGTGAVYYRLNQVDLDGTSKYSDIQSLFMGSSSADVMVAPNPVVTNVNLNNAQVGADYAIYSMSGQLVKSGKVSASVMSIDASNLPSGMYVIKTSTNAGAPVFKKFIKK